MYTYFRQDRWRCSVLCAPCPLYMRLCIHILDKIDGDALFCVLHAHCICAYVIHILDKIDGDALFCVLHVDCIRAYVIHILDKIDGDALFCVLHVHCICTYVIHILDKIDGDALFCVLHVHYIRAGDAVLMVMREEFFRAWHTCIHMQALNTCMYMYQWVI
jgi:hypothetical protein